MGVRIVTTFLLLVIASYALEDPILANSPPSSPKTSQMDIFIDLLSHKYAKNSPLKLSELTSLWTNLVTGHNQTSAQPLEDEALLSFCNTNFNQSPICQLITQVPTLSGLIN